MIDNRRAEVYLAALLHDIGKFWQRADDNHVANSRVLDQELKNNEALYCPTNAQGRTTHKHVLWTAQFFRTYKDAFSLKFSGEQQIKLGQIENLAASHHKGGNVLESIIQKADHYSSGIDRIELTEYESEPTKTSFKDVRMRSVFESLNNKTDKYSFTVPLDELRLTKSYFPDHEGKGDYARLWKGFINELAKVPETDISSFSNSLYALLEKYTSTIPSSTIHLPDVSLFDHLKTSAAFSVCLYDYLNEKNQLSNYSLSNDEQAFLLVGGDISGIQSYIYDIISRNAAKNLKGRSFYMQMLVDSIIEMFLDELKLYSSNIIYASGGGFYLLVPNTTEAILKINALRQRISKKMFEAHKTGLYLAIDYIPYTVNDLLTEKIGDIWKTLIEKLNRQKRQRFKEELVGNYDAFFEPMDIGRDAERDAITGEEFTEDELEKRQFEFISTSDGKLKIKSATANQIELGKKLRRAKYWIVSKDQIKQWKGIEAFNPCELGVYNYFVDDESLKRLKASAHISADNVTVYSINNTDLPFESISGNSISFGFRFYGGNQFPADEDGAPITFDQLAGDEAGFKRLGFLRMDVDNLGQMLINGFTNKKKTFSRYSTLSRALDFFFSGYLNTLWESKPDYKRYTYIVYAGGDDLFIVGRWDIIIKLAKEIQADFQAYTCGNESISISGGIAVVGDKFPAIKGAMLSGEAESLAKNHVVNDQVSKALIEKNSITLFGMPMNWKYEFPVVEELKDELLKLLEDEKAMPRGFIQKLQSFGQMRKQQEEKNRNPRWRWMIAYDFGRMKERLERNSQIVEFVNRLQTAIFTDTWNGKPLVSQYSFLELLSIAARWTELETR